MAVKEPATDHNGIPSHTAAPSAASNTHASPLQSSAEGADAAQRTKAGGSAGPQASSTAAATPEVDPALKRSARKAVLLYGLARLGLFLVLTAIIHTIAVVADLPVPLLISATLALIVAMPLSVFVFKGLRVRATTAVAQWHEHRKAYKEWLRHELARR